MEDNAKSIESLLEKATDYGKISYELAKLKALDKTQEAVSSFIPHYVVSVVITLFVLFSGLGLAFWLGEILGKPYFGFLGVAAFFAFAGIVIHFFMHKWIKKFVANCFIKQVYK
jgi:hypothetical protein